MKSLLAELNMRYFNSANRFMNISDRKLLSLRQKGLIPFSRIDRKIYYKKEDILSYVRNNLKTYTNNGNGTAGIE